MCGINGLIHKNADEKTLYKSIVKMNEYLQHRGPDDNGIFICNNIGLGHTRLSILDLSKSGHQPMQFNDIVIVYNGEIFNFKEIRQKLEKLQYKFYSNTDTEVILKAYHAFGINFIKELNGMFSLCIYDMKKNKMFLIRDRFGIKPLYFYKDNEKLVFSSEIKAILSCSNIKVSINKESVYEYLQFHYIKQPKTIYNEIMKVTPGYIYEIDLKNLYLNAINYYKLPSQSDTSNIYNEDEIITIFDNLLTDSISKRLISDVELGSFLSGGVDSSLITAIASKTTSSSIQTFSITFKNIKYFDESQYALKVAKKYNTKHTFLEIDIGKSLDDLEDMVYYLDEPLADTSVFLNYYISKLTKKHVTVVLSGLGADELFGGYNRYQAFLISKYLSNFKFLKIFKNLEVMGTKRTSVLGNFIRYLTKFSTSIEESPNSIYLKMISYDYLNDYNIGINSFHLNEILSYDIKYYMNDNLLNLTDKMSMANSLEVRTPFLDYRLVDFSFKIPEHLKTTPFNKKIILKKLALKYLPADIVYRRKQGFSAPIEIWLKLQGLENTKKLINFYLLEKYIPKNNILRNLDLFFNKNIDRSLHIYSYIILSKWYNYAQEKLNV